MRRSSGARKSEPRSAIRGMKCGNWLSVSFVELKLFKEPGPPWAFQFPGGFGLLQAYSADFEKLGGIRFLSSRLSYSCRTKS